MYERHSLATVGTSWAPPCGQDRPVPHRLLNCKRKILGTFARVLKPMIGGIRVVIPLFYRKVDIRVVTPLCAEKVGSEHLRQVLDKKLV